MSRHPSTFLDFPGTSINPAELKIVRARQFADYLDRVGEEVFASLKDVKLTPDGGEAIIFAVQVERPQKCKYDIKREEILVAVFTPTDANYPQVFALRRDFPNVPHLNLQREEFPRSLCLYDQPWTSVRLTWTPAQYLMRVRYWLGKTAVGALHAEDQPLEPLIVTSPAKLVLPSDFFTSGLNAKLLDIYYHNEQTEIYWGCWPSQGHERSAGRSVATIIQCPVQTHGIIRRIPENLLELHELCQAAGLNFAGILAAQIQDWYLSKPEKSILGARLVIILVLPKSREAGKTYETIETRAFMTGATVTEVGVELGVIGLHEGIQGYVMQPCPAPENLKKMPVLMLQILDSLSTGAAATRSGVALFEGNVFAVGLGALGSQIFADLMRSGFGRWSLVDHDLFLPHNGVRHFLSTSSVGQNKAVAMARWANHMFDNIQPAKGFAADFLAPGKSEVEIAKAYEEADLVLDMSASVNVSRCLGAKDSTARHVSTFMTPLGDCVVVTAEDRERRYRLDWLEMLHYRAVLQEPELAGSLRAQRRGIRYGNGCRDVSARLSQNQVALAAALASKAIRQLLDESGAFLLIHRVSEDGSVTTLKPEVTPLITFRVGDWSVVFDEALLRKMEELRQSRLPNETGGVLLGQFDTHRRTCYIIDLLPSPPDSVEWPTSYIRGCAGLVKELETIGTETDGQVVYVGEWHSHPDGFSIRPSEDDLTAYSWLEGHMNLEALPAIMMIVGDNRQVGLVASTRP